MLAAAAAALGIVALNQAPGAPDARLSKQIAVLSSQVESQKVELETARHLAVKEAASVSKISTCLPETTGEINGLTAEVGAGGIFLSQHVQVSGYCQPVLERR